MLELVPTNDLDTQVVAPRLVALFRLQLHAASCQQFVDDLWQHFLPYLSGWLAHQTCGQLYGSVTLLLAGEALEA